MHGWMGRAALGGQPPLPPLQQQPIAAQAVCWACLQGWTASSSRLSWPRAPPHSAPAGMASGGSVGHALAAGPCSVPHHTTRWCAHEHCRTSAPHVQLQSMCACRASKPATASTTCRTTADQRPSWHAPQLLALSANSLKLGACSARSSAWRALGGRQRGSRVRVGCGGILAAAAQHPATALARSMSCGTAPCRPPQLVRQASFILAAHPLAVGRCINVGHHLLQPLISQHPPQLLVGS